jgi:hypothetical protein
MVWNSACESTRCLRNVVQRWQVALLVRLLSSIGQARRKGGIAVKVTVKSGMIIFDIRQEKKVSKGSSVYAS